MMRKCIWTVVFLLPFFCFGQGRESKYSVGLSLSLSQSFNLSSEYFEGSGGGYGFSAGPVIECSLKPEKLSLRFGLVYNQLGFEGVHYTFGGDTALSEDHFITTIRHSAGVPVSLKYRLAKSNKFTLYAVPSVGYFYRFRSVEYTYVYVQNTKEWRDYIRSATDHTSSIAASLGIGAGIRIGKRLQLYLEPTYSNYFYFAFRKLEIDKSYSLFSGLKYDL